MSFIDEAKAEVDRKMGKGEGQFKSEEEAAYELITETLRDLIADEIDAVKAYSHLSELYGDVGWRKIFKRTLEDEKRHLEELTTLLERIKKAWIEKREILRE